MKFIPVLRPGVAGLFRFARGLVWILAAFGALREAPTYGATVKYSAPQQFQQDAHDLPGAKVSLSFGVANYFSHPSPVTMSNIVFNGRWFVVQPVSSQGKNYLNNYDSDVPLRVHFPTGARAFGAYFSSWIGPWFTNFTGTITTDQGDRFVIHGPTDSGSGAPSYLGLISNDLIYDVTFDDGAPVFNFHEEMVADVFAVLNPVPTFAMSRSPSGALNFQVGGATGQTVVLLSSTNLTDWLPIITNKLTSPVWGYTSAPSQVRSNEFFRLNVW